jgi:hypothetical protein
MTLLLAVAQRRAGGTERADLVALQVGSLDLRQLTELDDVHTSIQAQPDASGTTVLLPLSRT